MDWQVVSAALGSAVSLSVLAGLAVRVALVPYLRDHLFAPVQQTNKQVTENHHSNDQPTVLDRLDDVHNEVKAMSRMFDGHLDWSQREVDRIWNELQRRRRDRP